MNFLFAPRLFFFFFDTLSFKGLNNDFSDLFPRKRFFNFLSKVFPKGSPIFFKNGWFLMTTLKYCTSQYLIGQNPIEIAENCRLLQEKTVYGPINLKSVGSTELYFCNF